MCFLEARNLAQVTYAINHSLGRFFINIKEKLSEIIYDNTGAKIPASGNLSADQDAEDSILRRMESASPVIIDIDDLIIDPYESKEEDEEKLR